MSSSVENDDQELIFMSCDMGGLSGKERMAVKRQLKYRTDDAYRQKMKERAERSKQRAEYRANQRDYNRMYYLKMKEKLKEKRVSKKLSTSFEDQEEHSYVDVLPQEPQYQQEGEEYEEVMPMEQSEIEQCIEEEVEVDDNLEEVIIVEGEGENDVQPHEVYYSVKESPHDRRPVKVEVLDTEEEEEEEVDEEEQVEQILEEQEPEEVYEVEERVEQETQELEYHEYHSYPRPRSQVRRRGKARRGFDMATQVDIEEPNVIEIRSNTAEEFVHVVDVGTQVCQADLMG